MAITLASDLKVYEPEIQAGIYEGVAQFIEGVVAGSNGAIQMRSDITPGNYAKQAFFDLNLTVSRRDNTAITSVTPDALTQDENVWVKLNRSTNVIGISLDAMKKAGLSIESAFMNIGRQYAQVKLQNMINTGLIAVETAIQSVGLTYNAASASPLTLVTTDLIEGLGLFGDKSGDIVCWVMHSKPHTDLMKSQVTDKIFGVSNLTIYNGTIGSVNRPIIVTDSPALTDANGSAADTYNILGLTRGALDIVESEEDTLAISEIQVAQTNMSRNMKGEFAFSVGVKGMKYDVTDGPNPTDATLGTTGAWLKAVASDKHTAGVRIVAQ